ncbi:helix-turn-helix domain-containing protein [Streptomyces sp. NBC_00316]|uniref:helix-turn-helix domain-containing protein n=1 Tax=Streptomyces sp. NBC_00316 TaxID=2975710 RepID=UPI003FA73901
MARTGRPKAELRLSDEERAALEGWVRRRSTPQAWALRCRIILACAEGASNKDVAAQLGSTPHAVGRWRSRFVQYRMAGLGDMPRPGGPRTVTDEQVAAVVAKTLESTPKNATHWSTRSMAKEMGLSQSSVSRIWRAFGLQPHRSETFKLSTDPYFIDKVHDVVGLGGAQQRHRATAGPEEPGPGSITPVFGRWADQGFGGRLPPVADRLPQRLCQPLARTRPGRLDMQVEPRSGPRSPRRNGLHSWAAPLLRSET